MALPRVALSFHPLQGVPTVDSNSRGEWHYREQHRYARHSALLRLRENVGRVITRASTIRRVHQTPKKNTNKPTTVDLLQFCSRLVTSRVALGWELRASAQRTVRPNVVLNDDGAKRSHPNTCDTNNAGCI
jgi:hypothetical protein